MAPKENKLTDNQRLFVKEYIACNFNGAKAARNAGYKEKNARITAAELLKKPHIQVALSKEVEKRLKSIDVTAERVLSEIKTISFFNIQDVYDENGIIIPVQDLPPTVASNIAEVVLDSSQNIIKYKFFDKRGALEMFAKYFKLLTDKHEITGADGSLIGLSDDQLDAKIKKLMANGKKK